MMPNMLFGGGGGEFTTGPMVICPMVGIAWYFDFESNGITIVIFVE